MENNRKIIVAAWWFVNVNGQTGAIKLRGGIEGGCPEKVLFTTIPSAIIGRLVLWLGVNTDMGSTTAQYYSVSMQE